MQRSDLVRCGGRRRGHRVGTAGRRDAKLLSANLVKDVLVKEFHRLRFGLGIRLANAVLQRLQSSCEWNLSNGDAKSARKQTEMIADKLNMKNKRGLCVGSFRIRGE